ncbi:peptide chain release factor N(5)-glutamine methyltransferase [Acidithiobacillus sp. AMEEHan]|uniref:peptide chain release factor N(5)-glutamine methyltransferase n=1 Tax=Acidithiobacillus sp. AMEEHan TaxID=2994951 RepID=UPI0027E44241|nr:peptide chain release factor N(5)-glutamine methyltransferase [Acidithiobacillus sp. AMEEHan]
MTPEIPTSGDSLRHWLAWLRTQLAAHSDAPEQEAHWLLEEVLDSSTALWSHPQAPLGEARRGHLLALLARRVGGEPLPYCLGHWSFMELDLRIDRRALIPRPDTETLVRWALEHLPNKGAVLDLGTGCGAIILALAQARPDLDHWAVDRSEDALALARQNGAALGLPVRWCIGDWCQALPAEQRFSLVLSNPPYLAVDDAHLSELSAEPISALVAGETGLEAYQAILAGVVHHLEPQARIAFEHGHEQGPWLRQLLREHGWEEVETHRDLAGRERVSSAVWGTPYA